MRNLRVLGILPPPLLELPDLLLCCCRKADFPSPHKARSSASTSSPSTRRFASTSSCDATSARWRAARSSGESQSPGSRGRRATSVPSGSFVGSSIKSRPSWTRAFKVMRVGYQRDEFDIFTRSTNTTVTSSSTGRPSQWFWNRAKRCPRILAAGASRTAVSTPSNPISR